MFDSGIGGEIAVLLGGNRFTDTKLGVGVTVFSDIDNSVFYRAGFDFIRKQEIVESGSESGSVHFRLGIGHAIDNILLLGLEYSTIGNFSLRFGFRIN